MAETFSEILKQENQRDWKRCIGHRFIRQRCDGEFTDSQIAWYLVQEERYLGSLFLLIGAGIVETDSHAARVTLASFAGEMAGAENTYFEGFFESMGITVRMREDTPDLPATGKLKEIFKEAAATSDYAAIVSVLTVALWVYRDAAELTPFGTSPNLVDEWVNMHKYPGFGDFVTFLRSELDRVGQTRPETVRDFFRRTLRLEIELFDESLEAVAPKSWHATGVD